MSLGEVIYKGKHVYFFARSKLGVVRAYRDNRANRALLFNTFKEVADIGGGPPLKIGDHVMYAHRSGLKVSHITCIIYGTARDLSDCDYQITCSDGGVFNTTRDRINPLIPSLCPESL
jgi:hypothetical protein